MTDGFLVTLLNNSYENALLGFANKIWQDAEEENTFFNDLFKSGKTHHKLKNSGPKS